MSVLIKGMKMPTGENDLLQCIISPDGSVQYNLNFETRWHDGNAIEIPTHGDLIERKATGFTDFEIVMCDGDCKEGMKMLLEKIESAPAIIPASEDGE